MAPVIQWPMSWWSTTGIARLPEVEGAARLPEMSGAARVLEV